MRKELFICDHCGKELNEMKDFTNMHIDNFLEFMDTDLCSECFHELNDIVMQYIGKKKNDIHYKECKHLIFSDCYGECSKGYRGIVNPDSSCGKGEKKDSN